MHGPDFEVYHGKANAPLSGSVGFYLGGFPQKLPPGQSTVKSRLGRFSMKWQRTVESDSSITQEGIIEVDGLWLKADVWANAPNENQLNDLLSVLGRLPIFASGRIPESFAEIHDEMAREQQIQRLIWICWSALTLAVAWIVDQYCRRCQFSAASRLMIFAAVITLVIGVTIAVIGLSGDFGMLWFHRANMRLLFGAAVAVGGLALLLGSGLFLVRLFRAANKRRRFTVA
ncbi:MAG TPA: hypothetical protein VLH83_11380 [Chthoniobacterales bacterium]|nr:hypothetical protein [Chthoniobacterales bacterium]